MKIKTKIWLIAAACLVVFGGILFSGALVAADWEFSNLSTVNYETNDYNFAENIKDISISARTADITFVPSDTSEISVSCFERDFEKHSVSVSDGTLSIALETKRKWHEHITIDFLNPKITVFLPKGEYGALETALTTGDIELGEGFSFETVCIKGTTGDISLSGTKAKSIDLEVCTGNIFAEKITCSEDFNADFTTGHMSLSDILAKNVSLHGTTGDISFVYLNATEKLAAETTTGEIGFYFAATENLSLKTTTGDIHGTVLSDKFFTFERDSGTYEVPKFFYNKESSLATTTGRINILGAQDKSKKLRTAE